MTFYDDEQYEGGGDEGWYDEDPPARPAPSGAPLGRGSGRTAPRPTPRYGSGRGGPGGPGISRGARLLLGVGVTFVLLLGACGVWVQRQINPSGAPGEVKTIVVPEGASSSSIGDLLADQGIISSAFVWDWYLKVQGGGPFQAGEYALAEDSSMGDVVDIMERGPKPPEERRFTVPEGFTAEETLARLADPERGLGFDLATLQQLMEGGTIRSIYQPDGQASPEGILFPDTYEVDLEATPEQVLQLMVSQLDTTMGDLHVETGQTDFNLTPYEILITASLIEEETKIPEERAKVARVIYNRIRQGIPLGIDATSRYEAEVIRGDRNKIDFTSSSPYNTRKVKGLPPTPIASPGRASIEAALHPADGPWIYYVLEDAEGHHVFTDSAAEFSRAKQRCHDAGLGCG